SLPSLRETTNDVDIHAMGAASAESRSTKGLLLDPRNRASHCLVNLVGCLREVAALVSKGERGRARKTPNPFFRCRQLIRKSIASNSTVICHEIQRDPERLEGLDGLRPS